MGELLFRTAAEDAALPARMQALIDRVWPRFLLESSGAGTFGTADWMGVYRRWPQFQFALLTEADELVAAANAQPLPWTGDLADLPDEGWDWAMHAGKQAYENGRAGTLFCALSITVAPEYQGRGLSATVVKRMRQLGEQAGFMRLIAPVRPTRKQHYPLIPIQAYMGWRTAEGLPFDPWLRVHARVGAQFVKSCPRSMVMQGSIGAWEDWCGLSLPGNGHFVLPGLLAPLQVNRDQERGLYVEPNVWMVHG